MMKVTARQHWTSETPMEEREAYWGEVQHREEIAEGVVWVSSASHGGIVLSSDRYWSMDEEYLFASKRMMFGAEDGCFEEDLNWCIPVVAFPQLDWTSVLGWGVVRKAEYMYRNHVKRG